MDTTTLTRFWSRVDKTDTCWLWQGYTDRDGYGTFGANGKTYRVHRLAYELTVAPIPTGLQIDHLCRVRHCVRPDHLEPVTAMVNTMRGQTIAATNAGKTHCAHGHEYTEANTYRTSQGSRGCRVCHRRDSSRSGMKQRVVSSTANPD